jgi:class 3 adenylate cyclase
MTQHKTRLAVLFADVSDSTQLYEKLGDTAAFGQVRDCLALFKNIAIACRGRVVKTIGDGAMCVFPSADDAALAAREMQYRIGQLPARRGIKLAIRVGFHFGAVIQDGEDVYGDSVNVAARMAGLALSGQAITTGETAALLSAPLREATRRLDALPVKGKEAEVDVHELLWQSGAERTVMPGHGAPRTVDSGAARLVLSYRGADTVVSGGASFGRDPDSTIVVCDPMASRRHAKIELRAGKFVLVDQSTNGTFVTLGAEPEIRLRREEMILHGAGRIAFGHGAAEAGAEVLVFRCER